jgi:hypothetical protein
MWKEDEADDSRFKLDKYLLRMCRKDRLIELMHDFVLAIVARGTQVGQTEQTPEPLKNCPALRALYHKLKGLLASRVVSGARQG